MIRSLPRTNRMTFVTNLAIGTGNSMICSDIWHKYHELLIYVITSGIYIQPRRREIMQVIYFLFALEKFQCLFELISVSFYLCNLCLCEFLYRICWMKTTFQYFKLHQISSRRSPSSKSNKWAVTISVYFFNIWHKYSWAKKIKPV